MNGNRLPWSNGAVEATRTIRVLFASRVRVISTRICLALLCSCASSPNRHPDDSIRPKLPAEVFFNSEAGRQYVMVRVANGQEGLFGVDTGIPITILDKSLETKLGKRIGTLKRGFAFRDPEVMGIYEAPSLYLRDTQLLTGPYVLTADLQRPSDSRPALGTLGMNCLRHYCIQLDFADGKPRFLDPDHLNNDDLGKAFPLIIGTYSVSHILRDGASAFIDTNLFQGRNIRFWIDTGLTGDVDILLKSKQFRRLLRAQQPDDTETMASPLDLRAARFPRIEFGGQIYTNVVIGEIPEESWSFQGWIGAPFLARHLVTLNFPKRMMYFKRRSVGPLPKDDRSNSCHRSGSRSRTR